MKLTRILMGMTITIEVVDEFVTKLDLENVFNYFSTIDERFSTYKKTSEISKINRGELAFENVSEEMKIILTLCEKTKTETNGYFNIEKNKYKDPSGLVKGWAIYQASKELRSKGFKNFYIDAGGDIQTFGKNNQNKKWRVGIKNPFNVKEIVKILEVSNKGVATSGSYIRGQHVYDPFQPEQELTKVVSITVLGPNVYEADRFATAVFAMQRKGIEFLEKLKGFEGYMIDRKGVATYTSGFEKYVC